MKTSEKRICRRVLWRTFPRIGLPTSVRGTDEACLGVVHGGSTVRSCVRKAAISAGSGESEACGRSDISNQ